MPFVLILAGIGILGILFTSSDVGEFVDSDDTLYNLPDVKPEDQGGSFKKDYDLIFKSVQNETGVPFALLKAHAIQESSLNPRAFRDENPAKNPARLGWASRGLMQTLFWPGSTRFEQFGYTSADLDAGEKLFDPYTNVKIAAKLIAANLKACGGNVKDAVNMYNSGAKFSVREAPGNYTGKVLGYYSTLTKRTIA